LREAAKKDSDNAWVYTAWGERLLAIKLKKYTEAYDKFAKARKEKKSSNEKKSIIEQKHLDDLLEQIVEKAKKRKALSCKELSAELQKYEWPQEYEDTLGKIVLSLKRYQFKEAIAIIEEIL